MFPNDTVTSTELKSTERQLETSTSTSAKSALSTAVLPSTNIDLSGVVTPYLNILNARRNLTTIIKHLTSASVTPKYIKTSTQSFPQKKSTTVTNPSEMCTGP